MSTLHHTGRWAVLSGLALALTQPVVATAQGTGQALSGTWKLNPDRTAQENEFQEGADPRAGDGFRRRGGGQSGSVNRATGGQSGGARGGAGLALGPVGAYARPLPEIVIVQSDSTVTVTDPSGLIHTFWLDGRKESVQMPGTEPMEISARWKSGKLTVERKFTTLGSVREVYSLSKDGKGLMVEVRLTAPALSQPVDSKRIYEASAPKQ